MSIKQGNKTIAGSGYTKSEVDTIADGKANTDLSNLTFTGANMANWSSNVTNCITEIPQDIKLELVDGALKLKAGSKIYVPNSKDSDGNNIFDIITIQNDITDTPKENKQTLVCYNIVTKKMQANWLTNCASGDNPSGFSYGYYYNTTTNRLNDYRATIGDVASLPIAIVTDNGSIVTSIDQVFNGFGYIGSTVFALPGVKGLIPDGRNADGSLNNIVISTDSVKTYTYPSNFTVNDVEIGITTDFVIDTSYFTYNEKDNTLFNNSGLAKELLIAKANFNNSKITSFTPKTTFHAVDYNDREYIAHQAMPSDRYINLTLGASGAAYTAPADGWFIARQEYNGGFYQVSYVDGKSIVETTSNGTQMTFMIPVRKGRSIMYEYSNIVPRSYSYFIFLYANGAQ